MSSYQGGPPTQIGIEAQALESGLNDISVIEADNAWVTVPSFSNGTTEPIVITATKINQSLPSQVKLAVGDLAGNCTLCDPILTHVLTGKGNGREQTFSSVDAVDHMVTITNGNPGLQSFEILVNGRRFRLARLQTNERRMIDISRAMLPGAQNVLILRGNGNPGSQADVIIWDGAGN